jgi:ribosomal protein L1
MNKSRRYKEYKSKIDENKIYSLEEFFNFIKENEDLKEKVEGIRASVSLN